MPTVDELVKEHWKLIDISLSHLNAPPHADIPALKSAAMSALLDSARKYKPEYEYAFSSYALRIIKFRLHDEVRRHATTSRRAFHKLKQLREITAELMAVLKRYPTEAEIAEFMDISLDKLAKMRQASLGIQMLSFDETFDAGGEDSSGRLDLHGVIADDHSSLSDLEELEIIEMIRDCISQLDSPQKRRVIMGYYFEKMTLMEIAVALSLTESRVSQVRLEAVKDMRKLFIKMSHREGQPDLVIPDSRPVTTGKNNSKSKPSPPMSESTPVIVNNPDRIYWTTAEQEGLADAFIAERLKDFMASPLSLLDKAQSTAILPERKRPLTGVAMYGKEFHRILNERMSKIQKTIQCALQPCTIAAIEPTPTPTSEPLEATSASLVSPAADSSQQTTDASNKLMEMLKENAKLVYEIDEARKKIAQLELQVSSPKDEGLSQYSTGTLVGIALDRIFSNPVAATAIKSTLTVPPFTSVHKKQVLIYGVTETSDKDKIDNAIRDFARIHRHYVTDVGRNCDYLVVLKSGTDLHFQTQIKFHISPHRIMWADDIQELIVKLANINSRQ